MAVWVILIGKNGVLSNAETPHKVITSKEYLTHSQLFDEKQTKLINLASSYNYQSRGYYASLLAEARGHRVLPSVETIVDLSSKSLYEHTLPELEDILNKGYAGTDFKTLPSKLHIYFGKHPDKHLDRFAKLVFDWFRAPAIEINLQHNGQWVSISKIRLVPFATLKGEQRQLFLEALQMHTKREWKEAKQRVPAKYSIAVLVDPHDPFPPSSMSTVRYWARFAEKMGVEVEPLSKRDLTKLANYDALFIRQTTSISNHTYRFARRAVQEGMPVIDDPISMIRCTNKVYLHELLTSKGLQMPPTRILSSLADLPGAAKDIGFPIVVKIPDGSFSKGVTKAANMAELEQIAGMWFKDSDLLILQKYMPTEFDWRIGILDGKPIFASRYLMAKKHWQIIRHEVGKKVEEGGFMPISLQDTPPAILQLATSSANCIGRGLYGVDIKETPEGIFVIEVNDNPNIEHGVEDASEKEQVWTAITQWFIKEIEK